MQTVIINILSAFGVSIPFAILCVLSVLLLVQICK